MPADVMQKQWRTIAAAVLLSAAATPVPAATTTLVFDVFLNSRLVGSHQFDIETSDVRQYIRSTADFRVRVLGVPVYHYHHEAREQWFNNCLTRMDSKTSDNGKLLVVTGQQLRSGFQLSSPRNQTVGIACVASYAYWNIARLAGAPVLLNPQTGALDAIRLESLGEQTLTRNGRAEGARRYRLIGDKLAIDLWYSSAGKWIGLDSRVSGGRTLSYRLRSADQSAVE
jgi:hypothetical protein